MCTLSAMVHRFINSPFKATGILGVYYQVNECLGLIIFRHELIHKFDYLVFFLELSFST
jgi:hypothetical protein